MCVRAYVPACVRACVCTRAWVWNLEKNQYYAWMNQITMWIQGLAPCPVHGYQGKGWREANVFDSFGLICFPCEDITACRETPKHNQCLPATLKTLMTMKLLPLPRPLEQGTYPLFHPLSVHCDVLPKWGKLPCPSKTCPLALNYHPFPPESMNNGDGDEQKQQRLADEKQVEEWTTWWTNILEERTQIPARLSFEAIHQPRWQDSYEWPLTW